MLLDSNIIIYAAQPKYSELRRFIRDHSPSVSAISYVEVLGYHRLSQDERRNFEMFFAAATILPIDEAVLKQAVMLRSATKMSLGDALQAGTALAHGLTLVTRDIEDFKWIDGLTLLDPFATTTP